MIAGLKPRNDPAPEWQAIPILAQFYTYLQTTDRLSWNNASAHIHTLIRVSEKTGLSLDDLAGCDVDLVIIRGYPGRKWSALKHHKSAVRRWQSFRGMST